MLAGLLPLLGALTAGGRQRGSPSLRFYTLDMCPYAQRVWILLEELGVPYERQPVNLRDAAQKEQYQREVNPRGKVPALVDEEAGLTLYESHIVNEFLAERFSSCGGAELLPPGDAVLRAQIRLWNEHLDSQLAPAHFTLLMNKDEETASAKRAALDAALGHYEQRLEEGGPYLAGESFTLADVAAVPFFERLEFSLRHFKGLEPLENFPHTREWFELVQARPSFKVTKRPEDKLRELYEQFVASDYAFGGLNQNK